MASAPDRSVTESIRDDFLTCNICFEVFTDPRILPCLHTYCFQCICSHVDTTQAEGRPVVCPECREPITEAVKSLKANFFINGLTDIVKEKSTEEVICTACNLRGQESKAKVKCLDCGDYLCSSCADGHNASSLTWNHEKIAIDDIRQGTYDKKLRQLQKIKCPKHQDKDVEFYCESCSKSICLTCVVLDHRDHRCKTISEAVSVKKSNIIALTNKLRERLTVFDGREKEVMSNFESLKQTGKTERLDIETQAKEEITKINAKKMIALENITRTYRVKQNELQLQLDVLRLQMSVMSSSVNFSDEILQRGKDEEVLMLEAMVMERLEHLQKFQNVNAEASRQQSSNTDTKSATLSDTLSECDVPCDKKASVNKQGEQVLRTSDTAFKRTEGKVTINLTKQGTFAAQCRTDTDIPEIKDMAYSPKIGLIMTDKRNGKIKVFGSTMGDLQREITTTGFEPLTVAVAGDIIGAISENNLFLFNSTGPLRKKVNITEEKPNKGLRFTYSLAASACMGFIVGNIPGDSKLRFYDLNGNFTKYLDCSVSVPLAALSLTPSGDIVLSEWGSERLRVISSDGQKRFTVTEPGWKPNGTCVSKDGTIFVAELQWQNIAVFSPTGHHLLDFTTKSDVVQHPAAVAVDENDVLYVTSKSGKVCVYKIHKTMK